MEVWLHAFLTLALDEGGFTPGEIASGIH